MTYKNHCRNKSIRWSIAIYIKKHLSFKVGNALLNAIIKLLTQEVKNTASIQGIADAIVTLVDSKVNSETDVSTKKQLLDTKQQVLSLVRNQNNTSASTSLNDLITSVETITAQ